MAFLFKAFTLTIRTAAKPLANRFERYVVTHPTLRPRVIQLAQTLHAIEVAISRGAEGKTGRAFVGTMTEERALESAGKIASEGFILAVGISILGWEYRRQAGKDVDKKLKEEESRRQLVLEMKEHSQQQLMAHQVVLASMQARMEVLEDQIKAMQERKMQRSSSWTMGLMGR